jgi:hypothetical protein
MSTNTYSETFTRTHARHLSGRVASDLRQSHLIYRSPSEDMLDPYRIELEEMLFGGYLREYQFGYKRNDVTVWALRYVVEPGGLLSTSSAAGGVPSRIDVIGAHFFNFMTYSGAWYTLTDAQRAAVRAASGIVRTPGTLPGTGNGYWATDRSFTAGGVALQRTVFKELP